MPDVLANGVRLHCVTMGQRGPAIVFVHGILIDNHTSFYLSIAPRLAHDARIVLYDLRGHGLSEQPATGYTAGEMVDDLRGVLDGLGYDDAVIAGHSFGGYVALRFACRYPERTRGLLLLEAQTGMGDYAAQIAQTMHLTGEARDQKLRELFAPWLARHLARGGGDPAAGAGADAEATLRFGERLKRRRSSQLVATAERLRDATSFVADVAAAPPLGDDELAGIACPTLALYGDRSDLLPQGERLARVMPHARFVVVPDAEHGIIFQQPKFVAETTLDWLRGAIA